MFTPKANSKQKRVKKTQEHEKGYVVTRLLAVASKHCFLPCIAHRGELEASKHWSLSKSAIFNPKNPIIINLNPKTDRKHNLWSFYVWTSIIYEFYGLSTLLTSNSTSSTINFLILNPNSQILTNNNKSTC